MKNGKTICTVCNYIFDETLGEPRQEISPSMRFEDLPDVWRCPECGSVKEMFQPCSCVSLHEQTCLRSGGKVTVSAKTDSTTAMSAIPLGQLVAQRPLRACVLEQYGIDYCCGGKMTLEEACRQMSLPIEGVLEKLLEADTKEYSSFETDWTRSSLKELTDHIVRSYHNPLREQLPQLAQLAEKVAKVHGDGHPEMVELRDIFRGFKDQLELHMQKEELILFPGIVGIEAGAAPKSFGCGGGVEHPIEMMTSEHDDAGTAISAMRRLANDYVPPADACDSYKLLLYSLAKLETEMHQHVHKENNILFPRALALSQPAIVRP